ncbi:MAG: serine/threonine protein kinase, partial [Dactylosporangium sp.]|nr:serine/threonine protein kinase [Dactylosporangium sp.]
MLSRLGSGGMGTVYLGRSADHHDVAIKLVHPHLSADAEFRARFVSEANAGRRVPAFCSAPVLDTGTHEGRPYLVTEYIDGIPLSRFVAERGALDLPHLHALALGTAAGLAAIHGIGLVHRDIKPSNIVLTLGGVKIIDFGIARVLEETTGLTQTGIVMGSLGWAAPEQLEGAAPSPAMDVFAWGCVVAYAAAGKHPFGPGGVDTRAGRVLASPPELADVPGPVRALVESALGKKPAGRPTAEELLLALIGTAPSRRRRPGPFARCSRTAITAATAAI